MELTMERETMIGELVNYVSCTAMSGRRPSGKVFMML